MPAAPSPDSEAETRAGSEPIARRATLDAGAVFGPYRIVRPLGRGGMGDVYEAENQASGRRMALKILGQSFATKDATDRFLREGRLAASVSHPNSVYVYEVHAVDGVPAIAMELVHGGTLADAVERDGPMAPSQAVDVVLQLISGLEAAATRGVLHRDIKPANCFVDAKGFVKIGDYGLSMSTMTADETRMTLMGTFMGTPSYASPEQVRCDSVDVRSDIYSVGATMYFLLTGRPPFPQTGVMQVLSAVLQDTPEPPSRHVPSVPAGLGQLALRCLQKAPSARFATYADLRGALAPFGTAPMEPAAWRSRGLAIAIDMALMAPLMVPIARTPVWGDFITAVVQFLYFFVAEGRWGASIGKRLVGLRVVDRDGGTPGLASVAIRTATYMVAFSMPDLLELAGVPSDYSVTIGVLTTIALFATARHASGRLGLHERLSGTRTVHPGAKVPRVEAIPDAVELPADSRRSGERIGQFVARARLWEVEDEALDDADDPSLERRVWVHHTAPGTPAISAARQALASETRLRWLTGNDSGTARYDVYEAVPGGPLRPANWESARNWLMQVAAELDRGLGDGTLPETVGTDQVWIGTDGKARLLEFPMQRVAGATRLRVHDAETAQAFLTAIADQSLSAEARDAMPISAGAVLTNIGSRRYSNVGDISKALLPSQATPSRLTPRNRATTVALCAVIPITMLVIQIGGFQAHKALHANDRLVDMRAAVGLLAAIEGQQNENVGYRLGVAIGQRASKGPVEYTEAERQAFRVHVGTRFGESIGNEQAWGGLEGAGVNVKTRRPIAERAWQTSKDATAEERQQAGVVAARLVARLERVLEQRPSFWVEYLGDIQNGIWAVLLIEGAISILAAAVFRGPLFLRLLGFTVAAGGRKAARWRVILRSLLAWSPALAVLPVSMLLGLAGADSEALPLTAAILNAAFLAGAVWTIWHPDGSIHDRLTGTRIVPA